MISDTELVGESNKLIVVHSANDNDRDVGAFLNEVRNRSHERQSVSQRDYMPDRKDHGSIAEAELLPQLSPIRTA